MVSLWLAIAFGADASELPPLVEFEGRLGFSVLPQVWGPTGTRPVLGGTGQALGSLRLVPRVRIGAGLGLGWQPDSGMDSPSAVRLGARGFARWQLTPTVTVDAGVGFLFALRKDSALTAMPGLQLGAQSLFRGNRFGWWIEGRASGRFPMDGSLPLRDPAGSGLLGGMLVRL